MDGLFTRPVSTDSHGRVIRSKSTMYQVLDRLILQTTEEIGFGGVQWA